MDRTTISRILQIKQRRLAGSHFLIKQTLQTNYANNVTNPSQNSIRHNLTINKAFVRVPKGESDAPGKGAFWTIHLDHVQDFQDGVFVGKVRGSDYRSHAKLRLNEMDDEALMSRPETFRSLNEEHEYQLSNASRSHSDLHMPHDSINDASAYQPVYGGDEKTAFGYHGPPPMSRHPNYYYYGTNGQYYYNYVAPSATMGWQNQTPHQHGACSCSSCTNAPPTAEEDEDHAPHPCSLNQLQFQPFSFSSGAAATEQEESEMEKSYHNLAIDGSKEDMNRAWSVHLLIILFWFLGFSIINFVLIQKHAGYEERALCCVVKRCIKKSVSACVAYKITAQHLIRSEGRRLLVR